MSYRDMIPQLDPKWPHTKHELKHQQKMAKSEIHKRAGNLYDAAWWRWMPGETVSVAWPNGPIIKEHMDQYRTDEQLLSADPNDHYRPFLEKNVGRQGWDWNWGLRDNNAAENRLTIKVRKQHAKWLTMAALMWS